MSFGPIMQLAVGDLQVELAPFNREDVGAFVAPGMQQASVTRYLTNNGTAPTIHDEQEWYDKVRADKTRIVWGIWVVSGDTRTLIGSSTLFDLTPRPLYQAVSGVMIADKAYWGRGIASHIHKARTWYAFTHMGLVRIKSAVERGNGASLTALQRSGYNPVYVERNTAFVNGRLIHQDNLECLNPADWAWRQWWGSDRPTKSAVAARQRTRQAMEWAEANVTLL